MRNDSTIEREIDTAREDLQHRLTELRQVLRDKIDLPKRMRDLREVSERRIRERPLQSVGIAAGVGALLMLFLKR